jgi:hypothetical protein
MIGLHRLFVLWPPLLVFAMSACGDPADGPQSGASAGNFSDRVGLAGKPGQVSPSAAGPAGTEGAAGPASATSARPAFAPRENIVAAVRASRQRRKIPPDGALPQSSVTTEAELAARTRLEMDQALQATPQ